MDGSTWRSALVRKSLKSKVISNITVRINHWSCSVKKGVLSNFTKFTGKHLYQGLFFSKVAGLCLSKFLKIPFPTKHLWWLILHWRYIKIHCPWHVDPSRYIFLHWIKTTGVKIRPVLIFFIYFMNRWHEKLILRNNYNLQI